jgi:single-stranded DNA-binding protein
MSNTITITGNPTASPQLSSTRNGKSVTNFAIADNRQIKVDGD